MKQNTPEIGQILAQALGAGVQQPQECPCPSCTGAFDAENEAEMRTNLQEKVGTGNGLAYMHLHGKHGEAFHPITMTAAVGKNHPELVNMLLEYIPEHIAQHLMTEISFQLTNGPVKSADIKNGHQFEGADIGFSVPTRLYLIKDVTKLPSYAQDFQRIVYDELDILPEPLWQIVLPDANGKFPDEFGYDHQGMGWQVMYGEL